MYISSRSIPSMRSFNACARRCCKARRSGDDGEGAKPAGSDKDIKRLIINMERWRWMPEDLGDIYVWNNSPAFMLYVVKDGKTIYADKTLVGTIGYATPVFTADMKTIVFNPDWNAPETVVKENILPPLQRRNYSILRIHKFSSAITARRSIRPRSIGTGSTCLSYTFSQKPGPANNLGKVKFLFPNRHTVYMHDTLPVRKKYFKETARMIGHECVRMEKPDKFAAILLAEDKGWPAERVKELWDNGVNSSVSLEQKIPVHMVYFTAVADEGGKVGPFGRCLWAGPEDGCRPVRRRDRLSGAATGVEAAAVRRSRRLDARRAAHHRRQRFYARDGDGRLARTAIGCALLLGLRAIPRLDGIVQHGVELIVGGQLGDAFAETLRQRTAGRLLGEGDEHLGREQA